MSRGIVLIAFDSVTDQGNNIKYTELAKINANLIRKHLKLPVAIVTDKPIVGFDEQVIVTRPDGDCRHVRIGELHESYNWYNDYRRKLFDLTPFDNTVVIDVDYFVQTNQLLQLFDCDSDFMIMKDVYDPLGLDSFSNYRLLPNRTIPQCWATVMKFTKQSAVYFEYADMIAADYHYYSEIFKFTSGQYRNDMVFSIMAHMLPVDYIPWAMWMSNGLCDIVDANHNGIKIKQDNRVMRVKNDLHVLNKNIAVDENQLSMLKAWSLADD